MQKTATIAITILHLAALCGLALAEVAMPSILVIGVENQVQYVQDIADRSKFATEPNAVAVAGTSGNFGVVTIIADIVSVNGQPAKGVYVGRTRQVSLSPSPSPGEAIADVARTAIREAIFEILKSDGTPVGSIVGLGFSGGAAPPGAPLSQTGGSWAIVGGTGAFLGARGQFGGAQPRVSTSARQTSVREDPARKRINGGGSQQVVLTVIPLVAPEITWTSGQTAAAGEVLSVRAANLGPTVPGVDPGQPFPDSTRAVVNSPVEVKVNGKPAQLLSAFGIPGTLDQYELTFRLPEDLPSGRATIQLTAAWIAGPIVSVDIK
jgi:hypothetical protein